MDTRKSFAEFSGAALTCKHPLSMIIALLLVSAIGGVIIAIVPSMDITLMPLGYVPLALLAMVVLLLLCLRYIEYAFALMPFFLAVGDVSFVSIPSLATIAGSVDIRLAELTVALFALLYVFRLFVGHSKPLLTKEAKYMLFLGLWAAISLLWSPYLTKAVLLSTRFLLCIVSSLLCVNILAKKEDLFRIVLIWVVMATMIAIVGLIDFQANRASALEAMSLGSRSRLSAGQGRVKLWFGNANILAAYLNYGFALTLGVWRRTVSKPKRVVLVLSLVLIFFAMLTTLSRGAWLALAAGVAILGLLSKNKWRYAAIILVLIVLVLSTKLVQPYFVQVLSERLVSVTDFEEDESIRIRFLLWNAAIRIVGKQILWGVGFSTFAEEVGDYTYDLRKPVIFAHNSFIEVLVPLGLVGLTLYISVLGKLLAKMYSLYKRASDPLSKQISLGMLVGLVTLAVHNMFRSQLFEVHNWLFMGLCMSMINIHQDTFDQEG